MEWTEYGIRYRAFDMEAQPDRVFAPSGESWNSFHDRVAQMLEAARRAAECDQLREWVVDFLRSPGNDNAPLAEALSERTGGGSARCSCRWTSCTGRLSRATNRCS